ncbi:MAG TPA: glycosyltransferase family 39 protein [Ktedonobacteraceae bacterium]
MITQEKELEQQQLSSFQHTGFTSSILQEALLPYLATRFALVLVGLLADFYILPLLKSNPLISSVAMNTRFPDALWLMWNHFDAGFYVDIARNGYWSASSLHIMSNWIFLPLFPMFIHPLALFFGRSLAAFNIAGIIISNAAGLVAVAYLYLLVRREFNPRIASRTVFYLALFPTSFYLSAIYPESLFLAFALACIYYARQHRWWLAGICGALASLTRIQGFLLAVPVAWEYWQVLSDLYSPLPDMSEMTLSQKTYAWLHSRFLGLALASETLRNWVNALPIVLIPLGMVPFFIYSQIKTGDFLATIHNHHNWGRHSELPWQVITDALQHPQAPNPMNWNFWLLNIIVIFIFLGFTVWSVRRLPMIFTLYTLVMVVMPLTTASINSISRYYLVVFPAFILLALWSNSDKQPARHSLIIALFAPLLAVFMIFYTLGLPLIA